MRSALLMLLRQVGSSVDQREEGMQVTESLVVVNQNGICGNRVRGDEEVHPGKALPGCVGGSPGAWHTLPPRPSFQGRICTDEKNSCEAMRNLTASGFFSSPNRISVSVMAERTMLASDSLSRYVRRTLGERPVIR